jgi:hypothetical protein
MALSDRLILPQVNPAGNYLQSRNLPLARQIPLPPTFAPKSTKKWCFPPTFAPKNPYFRSFLGTPEVVDFVIRNRSGPVRGVKGAGDELYQWGKGTWVFFYICISYYY